MGFQKKHGKNRMDKYYHLAKDHGYRARSAFKLIQLNKKFSFLEKAKCCIDLCAAPGGWLQVAAKYMPQPSLIVGVDLVPIKPIPRVITFASDITTQKCRAQLKAELKHFKADVVLHDGAPNVGKTWLHDAFSQNELVLSSLKLASEFLAPGGVFVTKVFRSQDYDKLLWVFGKLFKKVEATKPASSRNVSAEIFVVCTGYLSPDKLDPRILDPKHVFAEVDAHVESDPRKRKENQMKLLNEIFNGKRKRFRNGYEEGVNVLHKEGKVWDFVTSPEPVSYLASHNAILLPDAKTCSELEKKILENKHTTAEVQECIQDLKVLGKKDFKLLLKWRDYIRKTTSLDRKAKNTTSKEGEESEEESGLEEPEEEDDAVPKTSEALVDQLDQATSLMEQREKRMKRKMKERKARQLMRMRFGMETPGEIGLEASADMGQDVYIEGALGSKGKMTVEGDIMSDEHSDNDEFCSDGDDGELEFEEDEDIERRYADMEGELEDQYQDYQNRKKDQKKRVADKKTAEFDEWYGVDDEIERAKMIKNSDSESDSKSDVDAETEHSAAKKNVKVLKAPKRSRDASEDEGDLSQDEEESQVLSKKARVFFDNPIFKDGLKDNNSGSESEDETIKKKKSMKSIFDMDMGDVESISELDDDIEEEENEDNNDFEVVKQVKDYDPLKDEYALKTAQAYSLAQRMLTKSGKRDLLDETFNRYTWNDSDELPQWFRDDEGRHNKIQIPVTKEAVELIKEKLKALDARPIKKVAEAKYRKKQKALRRLQKVQKQIGNVLEDGDAPDIAKMKELRKLTAKARRAGKTKDKVQVVVARGGNRGLAGRPTGVKGRYKMVDSRMKKEVRAMKRITKATKKKRR